MVLARRVARLKSCPLRTLTMNKQRRSLLIALAVAAASTLGGGLAGCASKAQVAEVTYTENVSTLLLSADGKELVVLGEKYHYVFPAPQEIVRLEASPLKTSVVAIIDPFTVQPDGSLGGSYTLEFKPADAAAPEAALAELGFVKEADGRWLFHGALSGKRYLIGNTLKQWRSQEKLQRTYTVTVRDLQSAHDRAADKLMSPVALASDGVFLIYFVLLAPILIPVLFLTEEKRGPIKETFH
mgnify:CR=1 FL=1